MAGGYFSFAQPVAQKQLESIKEYNSNEQSRIQLTPPVGTDIPVIDLAHFTTATEAELLHFRSALSDWGLFQVVNHGIESSLLDEVRRVSREFFKLPTSEKQNYVTQSGGDEGFSTDVLVADDQFPDWLEKLGLRIRPEYRRKLQYWPQNPESFRKVILEYGVKLREVETQILKLVAKSLNLGDEERLLKKVCVTYAQFNYYPPCLKADQILGLRQHTDASVITTLLQDEKVEGLQVLKDDTWFSVPIIPHALCIQVGDQLEILSNGIYKAVMHRVVRVSSETDRCTLAVFTTPDFAEDIGPLDELVDDEHPRMFKNVKNYIKFYYPFYHQGKIAIDQLRI